MIYSNPGLDALQQHLIPGPQLHGLKSNKKVLTHLSDSPIVRYVHRRCNDKQRHADVFRGKRAKIFGPSWRQQHYLLCTRYSAFHKNHLVLPHDRFHLVRISKVRLTTLINAIIAANAACTLYMQPVQQIQRGETLITKKQLHKFFLKTLLKVILAILTRYCNMICPTVCIIVTFYISALEILLLTYSLTYLLYLCMYVQGAPKKSNPLGKIRYLRNCSKFFHQIYRVHRRIQVTYPTNFIGIVGCIRKL